MKKIKISVELVKGADVPPDVRKRIEVNAEAFKHILFQQVKDSLKGAESAAEGTKA